MKLPAVKFRYAVSAPARERNAHHYLKEELPDWVNADWQTSLFKNLINYDHDMVAKSIGDDTNYKQLLILPFDN
jgi:hypothetical protein